MDDNDLFAALPLVTKPADAPSPAATPKAEAPRPAAAAPKANTTSSESEYGASSIRVLEGLEPVRMRPGMYIGGTDEKALHHLFAEVIDNAMDEAVAGHADFIDVHLDTEGFLTVTDNGRGIPVELHPQVPGKSTLEVIMTKLHAGGKFGGGSYTASGGLHGVGASVVNALSARCDVEVDRDGRVHLISVRRGVAGLFDGEGPDADRLAHRLAEAPGVETAAAFGAAIHVSGEDRAALEAAIAPWRQPPYRWTEVPPTLEDVFIQLMGRSQDNVS